jgi:hypothetical protein
VPQFRPVLADLGIFPYHPSIDVLPTVPHSSPPL